MSNATSNANMPHRQLNLFDAVCINVGIIIGSGIYTTTPFVANQVGGAWSLLGMWVLGGAIALLGALCYGELATAFPQHGGEYVYLTQGMGRRVGFLFAWAEFWIIRPSNIGAMAYVFGKYATQISALTGSRRDDMLYACAVIAGLSVLNVVGAKTTKWTQNFLTAVKVLGLIAICVVGLFFGSKSEEIPSTGEKTPTAQTEADPQPAPSTNYRLALILILFTYGGWNEISYVAAEVQNPRRNLWRALIFSTLIVAAIYSLVNLSFVQALGFTGLKKSDAVAADVMGLTLGRFGQSAMSILICLSCLGAINGMIFTGARISYALGRDHSAFAWLGQWNERLGSPTRATLLQGIVTLALVVGFGLRDLGFDQLVYYGAPVFWFFICLVVVSLFLLRRNSQASTNHIERVIFYPLTPLAFGASCAFMFYSSATYAFANRSYEAFWVLAVAVVGIGISLRSSPKESQGN